MTPYPLAPEPLLDEGTFWSSRGTPLTKPVIDRVDLDLLALAYAAETNFDIPEPELDSATRAAWVVGYRNPRVATHSETEQ